jgi:hypothetical protein
MEGTQAKRTQAQRGVADLPADVLLKVMALLPFRERAACARVCRGWRLLVSERELWQKLDLSDVRDADVARLLLGASAMAQGSLCELSVKVTAFREAEWTAAREVVAKNGHCLRRLHVGLFEPRCALAHLEDFVRSAPFLEVLGAECDIFRPLQLGPLVRSEAPWGPLRLSGVKISPGVGLSSLFSDMRAHSSLRSVELWNINLGNQDVCNSLLSFLGHESSCVRRLRLTRCTDHSYPHSVIGRVLQAGKTLEEVTFDGCYVTLSAHIGQALRSLSALKRIRVSDMHLRGFLEELVGHPSLVGVDLSKTCSSS